ncbi:MULTISPECIES: glycoside hydrolase family 3 N-terminal domain-containing protein [Streptomyces]|uniref:Beta-glucosidase n=1 Tax=Streptomyces coelicolor (strain ATCC BAA-471 / A3(2) / M145) TaxID=100226 RepID=Q9RL29_STRCO|nr:MULTISPECIES: glycoside hydrolase family 3 N-terminal domain-containing protein [Streptomyces]MDX2925382.1 glycoside hydrolase family 3 N-terminal domain-containing protein [Streptomyces sp. NRRL_B-16638]MYU39984.1 beta-glucosidase [Streptomyces sp. SID7813]NSL82858.1 beta-glucosidase [Streptomyces coelicolor]QFI40728.1 beta-glucosidase [Streptomyces coelicolor A3(2)]QKN64405.1 beta-glucosidase [Streptomyces coelicolor]
MTLPLYRDPAAPVPDRVRDLLGRMTLAEKVGQVNQRMYGWDAYERAGDGHRLTDAFRAEVAAFDGMGALYGLQRADAWSGVGFADGLDARDGARTAAAVQRYVMDHTRLGIPVLLVEEMPHGHQALDGTVLPVNLAVGATWDPDLYADAVAGAAAELRARGAHIALVSALDLVRDPRWGRSEECFSEDPYLAARMTEALVEGARRAGVAVVLKHFAGQGATVGGRNSAATELGPRELHEVHLAAARAGVAAGAAGVMAAYNEFDGLPCVANRYLLTDLLRTEWGFEGVVMADGTAVDRLVRLTGDPVSAGALALDAGCDLSLWDASFTRLGEAVERGLVSESALDAAVARVLTLKFRLGLFEQPLPPARSETVELPDPAELGERIARASVTLLAHEGGVLPLSRAVRRIAVLGPNADSVAQQIGDYTAPQRPGGGITVLEGIRAAVAAGTEVVHDRGCALVGDDVSGVPAAVALAAGSDVAVLVLGGSSARSPDTVFDANGAAVTGTGTPSGMTCGEGVDLADLALPPGQRALLTAVSATGTPVVVVLVQGRPHALTELDAPAAAVLSAWYPGPRGGRAVAEVLFGDAEPRGRLPVSVPRSAAQLPVYYNGKDHRYRGYADQSAGPLHAFGHGLSYTSVVYGAPRLSQARVGTRAPRLTCRVTVRNTGSRPAEETVQLYVRRLSGGSSWPRVRELRGFVRLTIAPGEEAEAVFEVDRDTLASVGRDLRLAVEPGLVELETGPASDRTTGVRLEITDSESNAT